MKDEGERESVRDPDSNPGIDWIRDHVRRYVESNGQDGHYFDARAAGASGLVPCLLLTTTGRRSGKPSTMPLFYAETPDGYVVIGSNSGAATHPAWHLNLQANPVARVQVGPDHYTVRARIAANEERARLWQQMVAIFPTYTKYQEATTREIPVVVLDRG